MSQTAFFGNQAENQKKADLERIRINNTLKPSIDIKKGFPIGYLFYLIKVLDLIKTIKIGKKTNKKNYGLDVEERDYQIELDKVKIIKKTRNY